MRGLNLDHVRAFTEVARLGTFSAAAEQLNLTQPAISQQIAQLEKRLGVALVERLARRAMPTAAGLELLDHAARIDGASPWMIFRRIMLPLARPGIAVTALFSFMTAWNEFIMASTFLTDEGKYTLPVLLQSSVGQFTAD